MMADNPYETPNSLPRSHASFSASSSFILEILFATLVTSLAFWRWTKYSDIGGSLMFPVVFNMVVLTIVASLILIGAQGVIRPLSTQMRFKARCNALAIVTCLLCFVKLTMHMIAFSAIGGTGSKEMQQIMRREGVSSENSSAWFASIDDRICAELFITMFLVLLMCGKYLYDLRSLQGTKGTAALTSNSDVAELADARETSAQSVLNPYVTSRSP